MARYQHWATLSRIHKITESIELVNRKSVVLKAKQQFQMEHIFYFLNSWNNHCIEII